VPTAQPTAPRVGGNPPRPAARERHRAHEGWSQSPPEGVLPAASVSDERCDLRSVRGVGTEGRGRAEAFGARSLLHPARPRARARSRQIPVRDGQLVGVQTSWRSLSDMATVVALKAKIKVCMFDPHGPVVYMQQGLTEAVTPYLQQKGWSGRPDAFV